MAQVRPDREKAGDQLRGDASRSVDQYIANGGGAAGNKGLVKFVEAGVGGDENDNEKRPAKMSFPAAGANAAKQQQAEDEIFGEVAALANDVMKLE
jgi:hypothetical protein